MLKIDRRQGQELQFKMENWMGRFTKENRSKGWGQWWQS